MQANSAGMNSRRRVSGYWRRFGAAVLFMMAVVPCISLAEIGGDFALTDHNGKRFALSDVRGKTVLMTFGFTHCPDVCPLELSTMAQVLKQSEDKAVVGVFVTLDPERDTTDRLASFAPFFHENILGLTGTVDEIQAVAEQYGVRYSRHGEGADYTIDHSAGVHVIDANGKLQSVAPFGATSGHLLSVLKQVE